jgi:hypothetical protein
MKESPIGGGILSQNGNRPDMFLFPCYDVRWDFDKLFMSCFVNVICIYIVFLRILLSNKISISDVIRVLTVIRRVSHVDQAFLTLPKHLRSPRF